MRCPCGKDAPDMEHEFCEGDPRNPTRIWTIRAPLYFKADDDNMKALEGYCSPECALRANPW